MTSSHLENIIIDGLKAIRKFHYLYSGDFGRAGKEAFSLFYPFDLKRGCN